MRARKILVIDDSAEFRSSVRKSLGGAFFVTEAATEADFRQEFRPFTYDLVILDLRLKTGREGLRLLREILEFDELQPVIMVSAYGDTDAILDSAEGGALMFLHKQEFTPELLARMVEAVLQQAHVRRHLVALQNRLATVEHPVLAGANPAIRRALDFMNRAADDPDTTVLVSGERGTGHDLVAEAIHDRSRERSSAPIIKAANFLYATDPRTSLFGVGKHNGTPRRKGLLEQANGGVLFLGAMETMDGSTRDMLWKTLRQRFLEAEGLRVPLNLQLVGGTTPEATEAIVDSLRMSGPGDRVLEIYLPPLRDRQEDIPVLATSFLQELRRNGATSASAFSRDARSAIEKQPWHGNVLELRAAIEFAAIQADLAKSDEIRAEHFPWHADAAASGENGESWDYRYHLARAEVALVERAIKENKGPNKSILAKNLGYTDRFAFGRRLRKAFQDHARLANEFPRAAALFA